MSRVNPSPSRIRTLTRDSQYSQQTSQTQTNDHLLQVVMSDASVEQQNQAPCLASFGCSKSCPTRSRRNPGESYLRSSLQDVQSTDAPSSSQADWPRIWHDTAYARGRAFSWNPYMENKPTADQTLSQFTSKLGWVPAGKYVCFMIHPMRLRLVKWSH